MAKTYSLTMHITPELKVFVGISSRNTWRYEGHWRGSSLEQEAAKFGWHRISHILVEDNLTKKQAIGMRRELVASAGCISINRAFLREVEPKKDMIMKEKQTNLMASTANGVKLSLTFDNRYLSKNGYPVVVRVYKDRKWGYVPTGFSMTADEFKNCKGQTLTTLEDKYNVVKEWCMKAVADGVFSINGAKQCLKEKNNTETLEGLINLKKETLSNLGTIQNYKSTVMQLRAAFKDGLSLKETNQETIKKFVEHLKKDKKSDTTINIYLSVVKASINYGIYKGLFDEKQYPFKKNAWEYDKVSLPKSAKRSDRYMSIEDMDRVWELFIETGNKWLGLFLFSYLTGGMNLADMIGLKFTREWVKNNAIQWTRKKTANKCSNTTKVPVSSWVEKLLERMGIEPVEGRLVFTFLDDSDYFKTKCKASTYINNALKKHGLGSMTYARHSFCTIMNKLGAPYSMIEQAMGHALSGVSSHYIAPYTTEEMLTWFEKLL